VSVPVTRRNESKRVKQANEEEMSLAEVKLLGAKDSMKEHACIAILSIRR
jgi:hypothetical protein